MDGYSTLNQITINNTRSKPASNYYLTTNNYYGILTTKKTTNQLSPKDNLSPSTTTTLIRYNVRNNCNSGGANSETEITNLLYYHNNETDDLL